MKSFNSIEKFLEERLDPKRRTIGESQLREHDQGKKEIPASKIFRIEFSELVPAEIKSFLNERLPSILDFPEKFGMKIQSSRHLLRFVDKTSYETEVGTPLPKNVSLPASQINYFSTTRTFKVTIIIPRNLDTAEAIINITRNLYSKLYGNIFFDEKILPLEFYKHNLKKELHISAAVPEILDLVSELNVPSKSLDKYCESIAKSYRFSMEKQGDDLKRQLTGEWKKKWNEQSLTTEEEHTIESMFTEFKESIRTNSEQIIDYMIERVKKLNNKLHYILPHESTDYQKFEKKHTNHYMRSILNKLEEISSLVGFIEELHLELNNLPEDTDLKEISTQIRMRMHQLRREKKVIHFYVPEIPMDEELEIIRQKFPLIMIKMIPKGTPLKDWSKTVKQMENHYSESIYSKLYSALHCLSVLTSERDNQKIVDINSGETGTRMKKILSFLKYSTTQIKPTQSTIGVLLEIVEQSNLVTKIGAVGQRKMIPLDEFKTAWSYFISSVLTLIFYQDSVNSDILPQGFNSDNYTKSILGYVDKQCSKSINHFHIVKLLWLIYDETLYSSKLNFLLFCLQNPQGLLSFVMNQIMRPQTAESPLESRLEKLPQYGKAWINAYQNRLDECSDKV